MFLKLLVCIALFYQPLEASVLSLGLFVLCLNIQECFNPFVDVDLVPEGPKRIPPYISRNQSPLGELLLGFLEYYAIHFRYLLWTLQGQVFQKSIHGSWTRLFFTSIPYLVSFLWPNSQPLLRCTLSCIFYSCFMFLAEGQEQVGTFGLSYHKSHYPSV